jgi:hypothetical protein
VREANGDQPATAQISVPSAATVALLSRGISHEEVVAALAISGDESLARGAIEIVAPLLGVPDA